MWIWESRPRQTSLTGLVGTAGCGPGPSSAETLLGGAAYRGCVTGKLWEQWLRLDFFAGWRLSCWPLNNYTYFRSYGPYRLSRLVFGCDSAVSVALFFDWIKEIFINFINLSHDLIFMTTDGLKLLNAFNICFINI